MIRREGQGLFGEIKQCEFCGKRLPASYNKTLCPNCIELQLLHEVKDYVRANDVNEYQVAEHFEIPLRIVKGWIKDGHLEYKTIPGSGLEIRGLYCENCGKPVSFGTLCPECLQAANKAKMHGFAVGKRGSDSKRMHHLWSDRKDK